jgi:hypothetical protein
MAFPAIEHLLRLARFAAVSDISLRGSLTLGPADLGIERMLPVHDLHDQRETVGRIEGGTGCYDPSKLGVWKGLQPKRGTTSGGRESGWPRVSRPAYGSRRSCQPSPSSMRSPKIENPRASRRPD